MIRYFLLLAGILSCCLNALANITADCQEMYEQSQILGYRYSRGELSQLSTLYSLSAQEKNCPVDFFPPINNLSKQKNSLKKALERCFSLSNLENYLQKPDPTTEEGNEQVWWMQSTAYCLSAAHKLHGLKILNTEEVGRLQNQLQAMQYAEKKWASETACQVRDFRSELPPGGFDQGRFGWCYAHTAALLVSHKLKMSISGSDIALGYNDPAYVEKLNQLLGFEDELDPETMSGGRTSAAIQLAQSRGGFCDEKDLPSRVFDRTTGGSRIKEIYDQTRQLTKWLRQTRFSQESRACLANNWESINMAFPRIADLSEFLALAARFDESKILFALQENTCKQRHKLSDDIKVCKSDWVSPSQNQIPSQSQQRRQDELIKKTKELIASNTPVEISVMYPFSPSGHSMVIVGQKINPVTKQCEFIVRNSWGPKCKDSYAESLPLTKAISAGENWVKSMQESCQNGDFMLPESVLSRSLSSISYLQNERCK